jgi:hypothetical protein
MLHPEGMKRAAVLLAMAQPARWHVSDATVADYADHLATPGLVSNKHSAIVRDIKRANPSESQDHALFSPTVKRRGSRQAQRYWQWATNQISFHRGSYRHQVPRWFPRFLLR